MKPGDLVKMKRGYSKPGVILAVPSSSLSSLLRNEWVRVLWPDYGQGLEKERDMEVVNDQR